MMITISDRAAKDPSFRIGLAVILALVSGLLSGALDDRLIIRDQPLVPGLVFGAAMTIIVAVTNRPRLFNLAALFLGVLIAWLCAYNATSLSEPLMTRIVRAILNRPAEPGNSSMLPYAFVLMGLVGGFVGSLLTCAAVSIAAQSFRTRQNWLRTIPIGFVAGALLETMNADGAFLHMKGTYLIFIIWQCAVAASIAYGLRSVSQATGRSPA